MLATRTTGGVVNVAVTTGGTGYAVAPSVAFSGGGGTGAAGVAVMAGTVVDAVIITSAGTGYTSPPAVSFASSIGTGAAAGASVYAGAMRRMHFFQGRTSEVYGVDGMGRGIRIDCGATSAVAMGLERPASVVVTASTAAAGKHIAAIQLTRQGAGYHATPSVTITGGTPSTQATARAVMTDGRITDVILTGRGAGYQAIPSVSFSGGFHGGATFGVSVSGRVGGIRILQPGSGYVSDNTTTPTIVFSSGQGLTQAMALPTVDSLGRIASVQVLAAGTGATTTGVTASIVGGGGSGAVIAVDMRYSVSGATVISGGTSHAGAPVLTCVPDAADPTGFGGIAICSQPVGESLTGVKITQGGDYAAPPTLEIADTSAEAVAVLSAPLRGKYFCAVRYIDELSGTASSISHLAEVDLPDGAAGINWSVPHAGVDSRVTAMELWRTTANQAVVLYRVATIKKTDPGWSATYSDGLPDHALADQSRVGYGLMPVTLPSGQLNARRFGVLPHHYAVGVMFQDRAWFAVDTTGARPNSLMFSEVDEPESVPFENELLLQENAGERDSIVALVPLGSELLVVQTGHTYSLRYVAQPIIDASLTLVAYRGVLNAACCTVMGGVAFLADSYGVWAFDGSQERPLSAAVDNYWRDKIIDFSKAGLCHMSSDYDAKVVRFHYCKPSDTLPTRALCYCIATEAWWEEEYPSAVTASAPVMLGGKRTHAFGTATGAFVRPAAGPDWTGPVAWQYRSGNLTLLDEPSRSVGVLYEPTASTCHLGLALHYNGSAAPRANAVATDRGSGFTTAQGATQAVLNMAAARSPLGTATGYAQALAAGRLAPRSAGGDRHIAVAFAGTQGSDPVKLHGVTIEGAT